MWKGEIAMKLLYCHFCRDIFGLRYEEIRRCRCGRVWGQYKPTDEITGHAEVGGVDPIVLGLANEDLQRHNAVRENILLTDILRCWYIRPSAYDWRELTINKER